MSFNRKSIFTFLISVFLSCTAQAQLTATGDDGREVILNEDGSWEYSSTDRYANTSDGRRILLKDDGNWEYQGKQQQPLSQQQYRNNSVNIHLDKIEIEEHKEPPTANRKNPRIKTQTSFYFTATASTLGDAITPLIKGTKGFIVTDDKGKRYSNIELSPAQPTAIKPGDSVSFKLKVKSSPKWGPKTILLTIDQQVFASGEAIVLTSPVANITTVIGSRE
jgi:hypothetical protein